MLGTVVSNYSCKLKNSVFLYFLVDWAGTLKNIENINNVIVNYN